MRRAEASGIEWGRTVRIDGKPVRTVDLSAKTVAIGPTRVVVAGSGIIAKDTPKSDNGSRVPLLDDVVTAQLDALQARQMSEMDAAGAAYEGGRHVASD